jgi:type IV secretion system protein VirB6
MVEPVIVMAGIIVMSQLFTVFLDSVTGYSVCYKCAFPFKIPFPNIAGLLPAALDTELFCIPWFTPWGYDHRNAVMGMNLSYMIILVMIAYTMWGYIDFAGKIAAKLVGSYGGPSATRMGGAMSKGIESKLMALGGKALKAMSKGSKKKDTGAEEKGSGGDDGGGAGTGKTSPGGLEARSGGDKEGDSEAKDSSSTESGESSSSTSGSGGSTTTPKAKLSTSGGDSGGARSTGSKGPDTKDNKNQKTDA